MTNLEKGLLGKEARSTLREEKMLKACFVGKMAERGMGGEHKASGRGTVSPGE